MIETRNLIIMETKLEDVETFAEWERRPEVTEFFSIREGQTRQEAFQKFFQDLEDPGALQFSIFLKCGEEPASAPGLGISAPGVTTTEPGLSATDQGLSATDQGLSATDQRLSATDQGLSATDQGPFATVPDLCSSDPDEDGQAFSDEEERLVLIGRAVICDLIPDWKCEIWRLYIADLNLRGRGYGKQALEALIKYCFEELGLERVYFDYYVGNPAAKLYESMGFVKEGVLRGNCRKDGVLHDVVLMSMMKDEYEKRKLVSDQ